MTIGGASRKDGCSKRQSSTARKQSGIVERWTMKISYSKYRAEKIEYNGIKFASKKEWRRYVVLKEMEDKREIQNLRLQVPYELIPAVYKDEEKQLKTKVKIVKKLVQRAVHYVADFVYDKDGETIVEDTKGMRTAEYKLKKKMMLALKGIQIKEV